MVFDFPNTVFSVFAAIGFVLALIPFYWHYKASNVALCLFMAWSSIGCLNGFINSVIWNTSISNSAPIWCDISTRIMVAEPVASTASTLCIARRLYADFSNKARSKRKEVFIDLVIGVGVPILEIILSYIVQGNRFDIYERVGCSPGIVNRPPSYALIYVWPIVLAAVIFIFITSVLTVRQHFINSNKSGSMGFGVFRWHYSDISFRLLVLSICCTVYAIIIPGYLISLDRRSSDYTAWVSFHDVHSHFSTVNQIAAADWRDDKATVIALEIGRWSPVLCAFSVFYLFGIVEEAAREYRRAFRLIKSRLCGVPPESDSASEMSTTKSSLPTPVIAQKAYESHGHGKWLET
ncbi:fungal pheromone STE3G-protein-coupled receptor [Artomyces pyxidatus]|uniref:Fungal pheromone STE3G-protein-coupled receptor n=1 Tax=Artomyces pyxidatus TaxID=48021 RepID=A0ACB8SYC0_9AGAM|nr:fungal pheromone STE3G-protein-coupled receptor [Artomyces pyxidatus]